MREPVAGLARGLARRGLDGVQRLVNRPVPDGVNVKIKPSRGELPSHLSDPVLIKVVQPVVARPSGRIVGLKQGRRRIRN